MDINGEIASEQFTLQVWDYQSDHEAQQEIANNFATHEDIVRTSTELDTVIESAFAGLRNATEADSQLEWDDLKNRLIDLEGMRKRLADSEKQNGIAPELVHVVHHKV